MRAAFRVDASLDIGIGHVMRCLTLADALREQDVRCLFVCRSHFGNLLELIRQRNHETYALPPVASRPHLGGHAQGEKPPEHAFWLGADWTDDEQQTRAALGDTLVDWLIVDHYGIDARWERSLRSVSRYLMVIDDLADRPHDCDLLLDQNLGRAIGDYSGLVPAGCKILAGPKYALLRPEFDALRHYSLARRATPQLKNLLITMGGVDQTNATGKVLNALQIVSLPTDCHITVVMGPHAPWLEQVRDKASQMPWPTEVLVNVRDMAKLMSESDLAFGTAGSTSWERCALGLPSIIVVVAENQQFIAKALDAAGAAKATSMLTLKGDIRTFFDQSSSIEFKLACNSAAAARITDGQGAATVARALFALEST